jgi:hypothetical protein
MGMRAVKGDGSSGCRRHGVGNDPVPADGFHAGEYPQTVR